MFLSLFNPHINLHLKVFFNLLLLLLLFVIYIVNLLVIRSRSYWFIYYFDTPALGRRHHSFDHINIPLTNRSYCNDSVNGSHFCNKNKCLLIIHIILLRVFFCNQPSFISLNKFIKISFDLIYQTTTNNTFTMR